MPFSSLEYKLRAGPSLYLSAPRAVNWCLIIFLNEYYVWRIERERIRVWKKWEEKGTTWRKTTSFSVVLPVAHQMPEMAGRLEQARRLWAARKPWVALRTNFASGSVIDRNALPRFFFREVSLPSCKECGHQTASNCQLFQGTPQLQKAVWPKAMPFPEIGYVPRLSIGGV